MKKTVYHCPLDDFTCPHYNREKMICTIYAPEECDDYYAFGGEEWEVEE